MPKHNIILAHNLTNDCVSQDPDFQNTRVHVGRGDVTRLFGEGGENQGKLLHFLKSAHTAQEGRNLNLAFIRDLHDPEDANQSAKLARYGNYNLTGTTGAQFVEPIAAMIQEDHMIDVSSICVPVTELQKLFQKILGIDLLNMTLQERAKIHLLLVGAHTDKGILNLASLLRNQLDFSNVAVCPQLVASNNREAHRVALQNQFPDHLVKVIPTTQAAAEYIGLSHEALGEVFPADQCKISPELADRKLLNPDQRAILISMFLEYEQIQISSLGGGFSGSLLLAVEGEKEGAKTRRFIVKLDHHAQMRREIDGYHKVKDYLGNEIPTFITMVASGEYTGVAMDVATMRGRPQTLQSVFEAAKDSDHLSQFFERLKHILNDLVEKLYANTKARKAFSPYPLLGLDNENQIAWLQDNIESIATLKGVDEKEIHLTDTLHISNFIGKFSDLVTNKGQIESEVCVVHGDLNYANLITDEHANVWAIDWTHTEERPVEMDFAKMENDAKFVMIKELEEQDLPRLQQLEAFFLDHLTLPHIEDLPTDLSFIKDDFKFQKLYLTVKIIRETYLSLKIDKDALMYRVALLKYSLHSLSFDRRMGRGQCRLPQLKYALLSTNMLVEKLTADSFHKAIH